MFFYFIAFIILGFLISTIIQNENIIIGLIIIIAIAWGITHATIWGLVSLGEMALGYFLSKVIKNKK